MIFLIFLCLLQSVVSAQNEDIGYMVCQPLSDGNEQIHLVSHPYECQNFFMCQGPIGILMNCPETLQFDPLLHFCNYESEVNCENTPRPIISSTTTMVPVTTVEVRETTPFEAEDTTTMEIKVETSTVESIPTRVDATAVQVQIIIEQKETTIRVDTTTTQDLVNTTDEEEATTETTSETTLEVTTFLDGTISAEESTTIQEDDTNIVEVETMAATKLTEGTTTGDRKDNAVTQVAHVEKVKASTEPKTITEPTTAQVETRVVKNSGHFLPIAL